METAGGTISSSRLLANSNFITALQNATIWNIIDVIWPHAAETSQGGLIDLKTLRTASLVGAPTFAANRGFTGNMTPGCLDSTYNPAVNGVNLTLNSAHIAHYVNVAGSEQGCGSWDGTNSVTMDDPYLDGLLYARVNNDATGGGFGSGLTTGFFIGDRINGTQVVSHANGTDLGTETHGSIGVPNISLTIGAINSNGTILAANTGRSAFFSAGGSLGALRSQYNAIVTAYLTSFGAQ